jgi:hypothetical protein
MTLYQAWCYKKALEEWKKRQTLMMLFRSRFEG